MLSFGAAMDGCEESEQLTAFVEVGLQVFGGKPTHFDNDFQPVLSLAGFLFADGDDMPEIGAADCAIRLPIIRSNGCAKPGHLAGNRIGSRFFGRREANRIIRTANAFVRFSNCCPNSLLVVIFFSSHRVMDFVRTSILLMPTTLVTSNFAL